MTNMQEKLLKSTKTPPLKLKNKVLKQSVNAFKDDEIKTIKNVKVINDTLSNYALLKQEANLINDQIKLLDNTGDLDKDQAKTDLYGEEKYLRKILNYDSAYYDVSTNLITNVPHVILNNTSKRIKSSQDKNAISYILFHTNIIPNLSASEEYFLFMLKVHLQNNALLLLNDMELIKVWKQLRLFNKSTRTILLNDWEVKYNQTFKDEEDALQWFMLKQSEVQQALKIVQDELVYCNFGLVIKLAPKQLGKWTVDDGSKIEDLSVAGISGLWRSIDRYIPQPNRKFSTYATNWIMQRIRALNRYGLINSPGHWANENKQLQIIATKGLNKDDREKAKNRLRTIAQSSVSLTSMDIPINDKGQGWDLDKDFDSPDVNSAHEINVERYTKLLEGIWTTDEMFAFAYCKGITIGAYNTEGKKLSYEKLIAQSHRSKAELLRDVSSAIRKIKQNPAIAQELLSYLQPHAAINNAWYNSDDLPTVLRMNHTPGLVLTFNEDRTIKHLKGLYTFQDQYRLKPYLTKYNEVKNIKMKTNTCLYVEVKDNHATILKFDEPKWKYLYFYAKRNGVIDLKELKRKLITTSKLYQLVIKYFKTYHKDWMYVMDKFTFLKNETLADEQNTFKAFKMRNWPDDFSKMKVSQSSKEKYHYQVVAHWINTKEIPLAYFEQFNQLFDHQLDSFTVYDFEKE